MLSLSQLVASRNLSKSFLKNWKPTVDDACFLFLENLIQVRRKENNCFSLDIERGSFTKVKLLLLFLTCDNVDDDDSGESPLPLIFVYVFRTLHFFFLPVFKLHCKFDQNTSMSHTHAVSKWL